jgi:hypothetical protein
MHYKIKYYNKPHSLRLSNVHICPLAKGVWFISCDLNLRGYEINSSGGSHDPKKEGYKKTDYSVWFGDDKDIRAELSLYPDSQEEADILLQVHQISKRTYEAIMVSNKCFSKSWESYCKERFYKIRTQRLFKKSP